MQVAQRCGRGVSAILCEKWRRNSSSRSERTPGGPRKMANNGGREGGPAPSVCFSVTLARFKLAVAWYRPLRCPSVEPELWRSSRSLLLSSPRLRPLLLLLRVCLESQPGACAQPWRSFLRLENIGNPETIPQSVLMSARRTRSVIDHYDQVLTRRSSIV